MGRADPGSPVSRLPLRIRSQGKARPVEEASALAGGKSGRRSSPGKLDESLRLGAGRIRRDASQGPAAGGGKAVPARLDRRRGSLGDRSDRSFSGDDQPPGRPGLVVAAARASTPTADGPTARWAAYADRCVCASEARSQRARPAPEAAKRPLIRRLSFDLPGLPPTPEEVDAFLNDTSPEPTSGSSTAISPRPSMASGGRGGGSTWLGTARATDSSMTSSARRPGAIATGWSTRSIATVRMTNSPAFSSPATFSGPTTRAVEATGFLVAGAYDTAGQNQQSLAMKAVVRGDELEDMIGTVSQTFLGLTVNCAAATTTSSTRSGRSNITVCLGIERSSPRRTRPFRDRPLQGESSDAWPVCARPTP